MTIAILSLVVFLLLANLGVPVFASLGIGAVLGLFLLGEPLSMIATVIYSGLHHYTFLAIPLFVLSGQLLLESGIGKGMFETANVLAGSIRNGLGVAAVFACALFAAVSGSSVTTALTIGLLAIPVLKEHGYPRGFSGSILASSGTLGILIPPSVGAILYSSMTDVSVGRLFMAGLLPGLLVAGLFAFYIAFLSPHKLPGKRYSWRDRFRVLKDSIWALLMPVLVLSLIYTGIATPTEVAGITVIYALGVGVFVYGLKSSQIAQATRKAGETVGIVMLLVVSGLLLGHVFTITGVPKSLAQAVIGANVGVVGTLLLITVIYLIAGAFIETTTMVLVSVPIFFPVIMAQGIDPLFFGIFVTMMTELAQLTPPMGINLFVVSQIGEIPFEEMLVEVIPFILIILLAVLLVWQFPFLYQYFPGRMD